MSNIYTRGINNEVIIGTMAMEYDVSDEDHVPFIITLALEKISDTTDHWVTFFPRLTGIKCLIKGVNNMEESLIFCC